MKINLASGNVIHIPDGNMKMGNLPSWSLPSGKTCSADACKTCYKEGCYACKMERIRASVRNAYADNLRACQGDLQGVEDALDHYFSSMTAPKYFRIHVAGDFYSREYFNMWLRVIATHPETRFMAFTKQFDVVAGHPLPKNFALIRSAWPGLDLPDLGLPTAWMDDGRDDRIPANAIPCPGNCATCGRCWALDGNDVVFKKH
jgi:hypothetical protein